MDYMYDVIDCLFGPGSIDAIANMGWTAWWDLCELAINNPVTPK